MGCVRAGGGLACQRDRNTVLIRPLGRALVMITVDPPCLLVPRRTPGLPRARSPRAPRAWEGQSRPGGCPQRTLWMLGPRAHSPGRRGWSGALGSPGPQDGCRQASKMGAGRGWSPSREWQKQGRGGPLERPLQHPRPDTGQWPHREGFAPVSHSMAPFPSVLRAGPGRQGGPAKSVSDGG